MERQPATSIRAAALPALDPHTPLAELEFVAFDTETTGCAAASGRMVEIGAVRFRLDGTTVADFQTLVDPQRPIPAQVVAVHGITDAAVCGAPTEAEALPPFLDFLGDPARTLLMAHNASFDMAFVGSALDRCGLAAPPHAIIDTVRLSRRRAAGLRSHSLRALVRAFGVAASTDHRGLSDSLVLAQVFRNLVARPPAPRTVGDLYRFSPPRRFGEERGERRGRDGRPRGPSPFAARDAVYGFVASRDADPGLSAAIAAGQVVSLLYDGGSSAGARRRVTPLRLVASPRADYLFAFCHLDQIEKQYRLDRIREWRVE